MQEGDTCSPPFSRKRAAAESTSWDCRRRTQGPVVRISPAAGSHAAFPERCCLGGSVLGWPSAEQLLQGVGVTAVRVPGAPRFSAHGDGLWGDTPAHNMRLDDCVARTWPLAGLQVGSACHRRWAFSEKRRGLCEQRDCSRAASPRRKQQDRQLRRSTRRAPAPRARAESDTPEGQDAPAPRPCLLLQTPLATQENAIGSARTAAAAPRAPHQPRRCRHRGREKLRAGLCLLTPMCHLVS